MDKSTFYKALSIIRTELKLRHKSCSMCPSLQKKLSTFWGDDKLQYSILTFATRTGLTGLFLSSLRRIASPQSGAATVSRLEDDFPSLRFRALTDMLLRSELEKIVKAFADDDCEMIVLKGPALAEKIYGGSDCRNHLDLDIMISPEAMVEGSNILGKCGYIKCEHAEEEDVCEFHHVSFQRQLPTGICSIVELHFRLRSTRYGGVDMEWCDIEPLTEKVADPFVHKRLRNDSLISHALLEAFEDGGSFRHLVDVIAMTETFDNCDLISNQTIENWHLKEARNYFLKIYPNSDNLQIPTSVEIENYNPDIIDPAELQSYWKGPVPPWWLFDPDKPLSLRLLYGHYIAGGAMMALRHLVLWGFFPPKSVMARRTGVKKDSIFIFFMYLLSPVIILISFFKEKN